MTDGGQWNPPRADDDDNDDGWLGRMSRQVRFAIKMHRISFLAAECGHEQRKEVARVSERIEITAPFIAILHMEV